MSSEKKRAMMNGKETYPFLMSFVPDPFLRKSEIELTKTQENKLKGLEELKKMLIKSRSESTCDQERKTGPCMAAFRRYFFNKKSGNYELFIYGGCQGNENNFETKEDCINTCIP
ncbi:hypothetical protein CDAR_25141 [Caerostris darwini]|uniref:BPTI/Kunitz inhibitor domain-containing protein n=1 Tax=Caerostris darwini TaxID=1538125 RepID=A0AAV4N173_9ARAC|nr:hypothetical protein CDAR_25141 [Caerostris darwini]